MFIGTGRRAPSTLLARFLLFDARLRSFSRSAQVWEALEAGSIPIIKAHASWAPLGDDHPIPTVKSWDEAGALLAELSGGAGGVGTIDDLQRDVSAWYQKLKQVGGCGVAVGWGSKGRTHVGAEQERLCRWW